MAKTKSATSSSTSTRTKIQDAYKIHVLEQGSPPISVYAFCTSLKIDEGAFYAEFSDLDAVQASIWSEAFDHLVQEIQSSPEYPDFLTREKVLTVYYAWFEFMKSMRSYALIDLKGIRFPQDFGKLKAWRSSFKSWAALTLDEGVRQGEIPGRSKLNETYPDLLWMQFGFLVKFWLNDSSKGFQETDEAIEKNIRLTFDLIEKNAVDSAFDLGKFILKQMR